MTRKLAALFALLFTAMVLCSCASDPPPPPEIQDTEDCSDNSRFKEDCQ